ncbi:MAG: hypothetical protein RR048_00045 [Oscillospiraceae bacterium]
MKTLWKKFRTANAVTDFFTIILLITCISAIKMTATDKIRCGHFFNCFLRT